MLYKTNQFYILISNIAYVYEKYIIIYQDDDFVPCFLFLPFIPKLGFYHGYYSTWKKHANSECMLVLELTACKLYLLQSEFSVSSIKHKFWYKKNLVLYQL